MGKWRKVVQCNDCKKIYPNGVPYLCYRCGAEIARESMFLGLVLTNNSRHVAARRRLFRWEVKQEDKT